MKILGLFLISLNLFANSISSDDEIVKNLDFFEEMDMIKTTETLSYIENKNLNQKNEISKIIEEEIPQMESIK